MALLIPIHHLYQDMLLVTPQPFWPRVHITKAYSQ